MALDPPIRPPTPREFTEMFFVRRFGRSPLEDTAYFEDWVKRFDEGRGWFESDLQSRNVITELENMMPQLPFRIPK